MAPRIHPGRLGPTQLADFDDFGVGGLLLAGSKVYKLANSGDDGPDHRQLLKGWGGAIHGQEIAQALSLKDEALQPPRAATQQSPSHGENWADLVALPTPGALVVLLTVARQAAVSLAGAGPGARGVVMAAATLVGGRMLGATGTLFRARPNHGRGQGDGKHEQ